MHRILYTVSDFSPREVEVSASHPLSRELHAPPSPDMALSVSAVEQILHYKFKDKRLLEEALTHSSFTGAPSYERLEFVGDMVLGLAISNHTFLAYPTLDPGQLSLLRAANISTEKLARVALKHGLYRFVRHNAAVLDEKVKDFDKAVSQEDDPVTYGGSVKAPKVLADIVESIAAAIYVDVGFDLQRAWVIFRGLLEPIVTPEDLQQQPQPVTTLFHFCQKQGKYVDIKHWRKGSINIASVYVDGVFTTSGSSEHKDIARLNAAKRALHKLTANIDESGEKFEVEGAKQKLFELCTKKKWPKPTYSKEKDEGLAHEKKFMSSVQIATEDGVLYMRGDEKSRIREAENSAASFMIRALQESDFQLGSSARLKRRKTM